MRGFIHDMGRTTTHKRWIIEMYLNGYTTRQIQERTDHEIPSLDRYIKRYKAVEKIIVELKTVDAVKISRILDIASTLPVNILQFILSIKRHLR